jgi:hypothetical protein
MKKFAPLAVLAISFLLLSSLSLAQDLKVTISNNNIVAYSNETQAVEINIFNNQDFADKFSITVFPTQSPDGITVILGDYVLTVPSRSNATTKLYINVPECPEEVNRIFTINVKSITDDTLIESKSISLNPIRKYQVCLSDLTLDKYLINPGDAITIRTSITNPTSTPSMPLNLRTNILRNKDVIESFDERIESVLSKSTQKVERVYSFNKYIAYGFYTIEVVLKDSFNRVISSKKTDLRVVAAENVTFEKTSKWGLMGQTIVIKVKNEGNNVSREILVTEAVPLFLKPFFFPKIEPKSETVKENRIVYTWVVDSLQAGEEKTIIYEINLTSAWVIVLILAILVFFAFKYVFTLSLIKKHKYIRPLTKEREISIFLEARNRTRHLIKDLYIRDFVPSIATVVEKFDTLRPVMRKTAGGTELVWKLNFLRPGEERVITYRIKPVIEIAGTLKLPNAHMRYESKKKEIRRVFSKSTFFKQK